MRILTLANHVGSKGGLERHQLEVCRGLARRGHEIHLLYQEPGDFLTGWEGFAAGTVPIAASLPRRRALLPSSLGVARAARAGAARRPDVVTAFRYWDVPLALAIGALAGAPAVGHLALPPPEPLPAWLSASLRRLRRCIAASADVAGRWERAARLGPDRITVVPNGVDLARFTPTDHVGRVDARRRLGLEPEVPLLALASRLDPAKGVHVAVAALAALLPGPATHGEPGVRLVVAGGRPLGLAPEDAAAYEHRLREESAGLPVTWLGPVPDSAPLFQAADLALVPSLAAEAFGLAAAEAMACATPAICSAVGGLPEVVGELGETLLVPPDDPGALAGRIASLLDWRTNDPSLGSRCRERIASRFSLERMVSETEEALALLARHRDGSPRRAVRGRPLAAGADRREPP